MKLSIVEGVISTTSKGFGFIEDPENADKDIFIEVGNLNTALNGDTVKVKVHGTLSPKGKTGEVVEVVSRAKELFVGTVTLEKGAIVVVPDDKRMYVSISIPAKNTPTEVKNGDKVYLQLSPWTDPKQNPQGTILRVLGQKGINDVEMESIVLEKGFDTKFPAGVEKEAHEIEKRKQQSLDEELKTRRDMRSTLTLTIDPFDAKDFDDAISFVDHKDGTYEIGVHIADVSYYVTEGSALDKEAIHRGCSIYLVDRTIPMLPEILSNDVCSLNPGSDKLAFSAVFTMNDQGAVLKRWFGRTVINSAFRFTYETAQAVIDDKTSSDHEHAKVSNPVEGLKYRPELLKLNTIAKILQKEKFAKGAIEFEQDEIKFKLDAHGKPIGVYRKSRLDTHKLVEEYMLLANREVAKYISDEIIRKGHKHAASVYRIHDVPDKEKILDLSLFAKALGYDLHVGEKGVTVHALKSLIKQVEGTPHESLIKTATVRSMQKAIYSTKNIGHFGLAFEFYTHFTSPIRRYPDLLVHRILENHLKHNKFGDKEMAIFQHIADKSTQREISAAEAERASIKLKQVEYMADKVGKEFDGTISGVTEWGMYVEENESKSEGMIKLRDLSDDFYSFNKKTYSLIGQKTGKTYTLGGPVRFKVVAADLDKKVLDFVLVP
ncbi:MAG: ribonuclease R [Candidatus Taylorbacteria bacterium]|nr:ribonuclease R [Candidatus Taylorbacteria bacterium]